MLPVFTRCVEAIRENILIKRVSVSDKEYHFQNWFKGRLEETSFHFEDSGRNTYPDFRMVSTAVGGYGDLLIRDRKMYVVPTPYRIAGGLAHHHTLVLPSDVDAGTEFFEVGELVRTEATELIVGYSFDLQTNEILPKKAPNPSAETKHVFRAWRLKGAPSTAVNMRPIQSISIEADPADDEANE
ncbi:MAG: hypothetical protein H0U76_23785 [Ktedonobacteraceae bacterium]|nr:hypothetical protein [Ktedonobacteraceae bacterium]